VPSGTAPSHRIRISRNCGLRVRTHPGLESGVRIPLVPGYALFVTGTGLVGKGGRPQSEETHPHCHNDGNDPFHTVTPDLRQRCHTGYTRRETPQSSKESKRSSPVGAGGRPRCGSVLKSVRRRSTFRVRVRASPIGTSGMRNRTHRARVGGRGRGAAASVRHRGGGGNRLEADPTAVRRAHRETRPERRMVTSIAAVGRFTTTRAGSSLGTRVRFPGPLPLFGRRRPGHPCLRLRSRDLSR